MRAVVHLEDLVPTIPLEQGWDDADTKSRTHEQGKAVRGNRDDLPFPPMRLGDACYDAIVRLHDD
jgi:hypothetical protein